MSDFEIDKIKQIFGEHSLTVKDVKYGVHYVNGALSEQEIEQGCADGDEIDIYVEGVDGPVRIVELNSGSAFFNQFSGVTNLPTLPSEPQKLEDVIKVAAAHLKAEL